MTAAAALIQRIREGAYDALFARLYGESRVKSPVMSNSLGRQLSSAYPAKAPFTQT